MRKAFTSFVALLLCVGMLAPAAVPNLDAAMMGSHQACARAAGGHHQHDHCMGMAMASELGASAQPSHNCCHDCCLGLALSSSAKSRPQSRVQSAPIAVSQQLLHEIDFFTPSARHTGQQAQRAPPLA